MLESIAGGDTATAQLTAQLLTALFGAIVGALAGAIPAYFLARAADRQTAAREAGARFAEERLLALRAGILIDEVAASLKTFLSHVASRLGTIHPSSGKRPWMVVPSLGGITETEFTFPPEVLAFIVGRGKPDLGHNLLILAKRFDSILIALRLYNARWHQLDLDLDAAHRANLAKSFDEVVTETSVPLQDRLDEHVLSQGPAMARLLEFTKQCSEEALEFFQTYFKDSQFPTPRELRGHEGPLFPNLAKGGLSAENSDSIHFPG